MLSQNFAIYLAVGRTPASAPDPLVRLYHHTRQRPTGAATAVQGDRPTSGILETRYRA
ncbi:MAG: hypothetical protein JWO48_1051 [Bryobacterales bacterium]|nr:hypothetical protein [Bryobacterales bacterium]